ncbi:MAG: PilN domain-containing protein [Arenicellales bacterium]
MTNINLLPWREAQRANNDRKLLAVSILFWGLCLLGGYIAFKHVSDMLAHQQDRNQYLIVENSRLNREIKDIEKLQAEKVELVGRIDVIQNLQQDRMQVVHVFDDIVRKLPPGVTLDTMTKKSQNISLKGRAQSNSRVSELMNKLDTSQWFGGSNLSVVSLKETKDSQLSLFELAITEKTQTLNTSSEAN